MAKLEPGGRVLLGNVVRAFFLDAGGKLKYRPYKDRNGKTNWSVFGVRSDGSKSQVYIARNGEPKRFRSANAILSVYHRSMFPQDEGVFVPWLPGDEEGSEDDGEDIEETSSKSGATGLKQRDFDQSLQGTNKTPLHHYDRQSRV